MCVCVFSSISVADNSGPACRCGKCDGKHNCGVLCDRPLFCEHICGQPCHLGHDCIPCRRKCPRRCVHSRCAGGCCEPVSDMVGISSSLRHSVSTIFVPVEQCSSCVEECDWECEHQGNCPLVCGAPCLRLPCNKVS